MSSLSASSSDMQFVYHHLPKTAGSTFRTILHSLFSEDKVCPHEVEYLFEDMSDDERGQYQLFAGHFSYSFVVEQFPDAAKLVFLRHPVARVVSQYYNFHDSYRIPEHWMVHHRAAPPEFQEFMKWAENASLDEFVRSDNPYAVQIYQNYQTVFLTDQSIPPFFDPPEFSSEFDQALLDKAKGNLETVFDFVGIQEDFRFSLNLFCATFGYRPIGDFRPMIRNLNPRKDARKAYDVKPETMRRILDCNRMDVELWEYGRDLLHARVGNIFSSRLELDASVREMPIVPDSQYFPLRECRDRKGFYWTEQNPQGVEYAWTGYESPALIEFDSPFPEGSRVRIELHVLDFISPGIIQTLRLEIDGDPVDFKLVQREEEHALVADTRIGFFPRCVHTIKIFSATRKEGESGNSRELGCAVAGVTVSVLSPSEPDR
ncbi:sulfotransferase family 2 domain-containing protein [Pseudodesulfovibrio tunisiensis]|uniref:sulfotransferase family 2 domain-containing protein n=1 Tax=Pseudodesulfovibrio tunisiensis TaxID=463192 RepID=UPI001FB42925|nr:sulfotransferase family 2 domain-containing protein [Pseudodesulfovibrio tunisiensis]